MKIDNSEVRGRWSAIVLAGQRPEGDPLADRFGVAAKALVPIAGEAMLARVVRTLLASPSIGRILLLAQKPERLLFGATEWIAAEPRVALAASGAGIATSLAAVAGKEDAPWPVLVTTADHPLLTAEMVEAFLAGCAGCDIAAGVVERAVMLESYPHNRRTWLKFRGGAYTGANLFALANAGVLPALELVAAAEADRKNQVRLLRHFGLLLALRAATRTISLPDAFARGFRRFGLEGKVVPLPMAEAGIDVDKVEDLHLAERILDARAA
jgi:GTP:adenosylcobinamide-phosphate guanylyltransferase